MVEPAPAIRRRPVLGAITPPSIEFLVHWREMPKRIDPAAFFDNFLELVGLDRRVADHFQQRLVAPDVMLVLGDIQIADDNRMVIGQRWLVDPAFQLIEKRQLMGEFGIDCGVGLVAAGRHIKIVYAQALVADRHTRRNMTGVAHFAKATTHDFVQRQAGGDRHAVIALLAIYREMFITELAEIITRKLTIAALGFLKAQNVGGLLVQKPRDLRKAKANRINVPRGELQIHG